MIAAILLFASTAGAQSPSGESQINDADWIKSLNGIENSTWTAGHNEFWNGMSFDDARILLGTELDHISDHLNKTLDDSYYEAMVAPPAKFDARTRWPGLIHPIRDQGGCGSSWAFASSEVLSDRVAIITQKASRVLSPEDMVSCDTNNKGCNGGGWHAFAWGYLTKTGIVSDACFPYTAGNGVAPKCPLECAWWSFETWASSKVKAKPAYAINGIQNMMKEVMIDGPIQVAFKVYKSFMSYKSGVYSKPSWETDVWLLGGHSVKMVGWGTDRGVDYWLLANSWSTYWGEAGFFRIKRGSNECGIETLGPPYTGKPAVDELLLI